MPDSLQTIAHNAIELNHNHFNTDNNTQFSTHKHISPEFTCTSYS